MPLLTLMSRVSDGLMLSESMDSGKNDTDMEYYRSQAKQIFKTLSRKSQNKMYIEAGVYFFAYLIENDVCYLTLAEKTYPKKLAFSFLEELQKEFDTSYGEEVPQAKRPYAFIKFDTFIQKTKKLYLDTRSQRNMNKVAEDLQDIQRIMSKNIQDILGRGEKISSVSAKTDALLAESEKYEKKTVALNTQLFWRKYGPVIVVVFIVVFLLYARFAYF